MLSLVWYDVCEPELNYQIVVALTIKFSFFYLFFIKVKMQLLDFIPFWNLKIYNLQLNFKPSERYFATLFKAIL